MKAELYSTYKNSKNSNGKGTTEGLLDFFTLKLALEATDILLLMKVERKNKIVTIDGVKGDGGATI